MNATNHVLLRTTILSLTLATAVLAQNAPEGGALMREAERTLPEANTGIPSTQIEMPRSEIVDTEQRVAVNHYNFSGNTLVDSSVLKSLSASYTGRQVSFSEINSMLAKLSDAYMQRGYLARFYLPVQEVNDGNILINVVEARVGEIRVEKESGAKGLPVSDIRRMIEVGQSGSSFMDLRKLERSALIMGELPGIRAKVILSAGERVGFTDIVVVEEDVSSFAASLAIDNYGSRSTGEIRGTVVSQYGGLISAGDGLRFNGLLSEGNRYGGINYTRPIGIGGLRAGVSTSLLDYELIGDFSDLDSQGRATSFDFNISYPIIRQGNSRMDANVRIGRRSYKSEQFGIETSDKIIDAIKLEVHGRRSDNWFGGGQIYYGLDFTSGDLDLSGNPTNELMDRWGPNTQGSYQVYNISLGRIQRLTPKSNLELSFLGQLGSKRLDSSETLVLGGVSGVRAYPVLEGTGDEGWMINAEYRYSVAGNITIKAFYDYGEVSNSGSYDISQLKGIGAGLTWSPSTRVYVSGMAAHRIGDNPLRNPQTGNDTDGSKRDLRTWIQAGITF